MLLSLRHRLQKTLTLTFFISICGTAALAQTPSPYNHVVSIIEDKGGRFVLVGTSKTKMVLRPYVQYLPGENGSTIMVADFPDLEFDKPPTIFSPPVSGLIQVRFAQLQVSPPVFRVAITTAEPDILKGLEFHTKPGILIIKWPASYCRSTKPPAKITWSPYAPTTSFTPAVIPSLAPSLSAPTPGQPLQTTAASKSSTPLQTAASSKSSASLQTPAVRKSLPPQVPAATSGITSENKTDHAISKAAPPVAPDFCLPKLGPLSTKDSQTKSQANLPPIKDKPIDPQGSLPPVAMVAASQVTGNTQALPTDSSQPDVAQTFLDRIKRSANFLQTNSQDSVQKLLPQIARQTNLIVSQTVPPEAPSIRSSQPISISGFCPLKIVVSANSILSYKAFRLHEPERYVIDIQGLPDLTRSAEPGLPENGFVNGLRLSHGDQDSNRLVLDLSGCDIPIKETVSDDKKSLSLLIGGGVNLFARLQAPTNSVVVLDAGHGGSDPGAERGDIQEKEITLDIVAKLKNYLQSKGLKVILTRSTDTFVSLEDRVNITNSIKPDCFISVHVNSMEATSSIHGIETYYQTQQSKQLACVINDSLVGNLNASDHNVRQARFYVVNHTPVPAILAEVGFISNKEERERLISSDYQSKVAEALADGVILYLDKKDDMVSVSENATKQAGKGGVALSNRAGTLFK